MWAYSTGLYKCPCRNDAIFTQQLCVRLLSVRANDVYTSPFFLTLLSRVSASAWGFTRAQRLRDMITG